MTVLSYTLLAMDQIFTGPDHICKYWIIQSRATLGNAKVVKSKQLLLNIPHPTIDWLKQVSLKAMHILIRPNVGTLYR